jgi:hypothetical protein
MSIIKNLFERKANTAAAIREKLEALQNATPLADMERLQSERRALLLASDADDKVVKLEQQIASAQREEDRRQLALAAVRTQLAEAEASEHQAELKRLRSLAEQAKRRAPDLYAKYEQHAESIYLMLDAIDELQAAVDAYNAVAPQSEQLTSLNHDARGGKPGEQRIERGRRELGKFWAFSDSGREVPGRLLTTLESNGTNGTVQIIDFDNTGTSQAALPAVDGQDPEGWLPKRRVPVVLLRGTEISFDDARPAFVPPPLRHGVSLPHVVLADDRAPRQMGTTIVTEKVEAPATTSTEAA